MESAKTLVHAFVTSKLVNCNAFLYGLLKYQIQRLQYMLNSDVRLVTLSRKHDHISPVLMELHQLPVEQRVGLKILLFTPKVVNGMTPVYLQDLLDLYRPCRSLRSGNMQLLKTKSYNLKSHGFRAFSICAPRPPNFGMPFHVRELRVCHSVGSFRQTLLWTYVRDWSQNFGLLFKLYLFF